MSRDTVRVLAALAFLAYFGAWFYGPLEIDRGDVFESRVVHYGTFVVLPCLLVGAALGRWWAVAVCLVFPAIQLLPERCETTSASDVVATTCAGGGGDWAYVPVELAITVPFVLAGVVLAVLVQRHRPRAGGRPVL